MNSYKLNAEIFDKLIKAYNDMVEAANEYCSVFGNILNGMMPITKTDVELSTDNKSIKFTKEYIYIDDMPIRIDKLTASTGLWLTPISKPSLVNALLQLVTAFVTVRIPPLAVVLASCSDKIIANANDDIKECLCNVLQINKEVISKIHNNTIKEAVKIKLKTGEATYITTKIRVGLNDIDVYIKDKSESKKKAKKREITINAENCNEYEFIDNDNIISKVIEKAIDYRINNTNLFNNAKKELMNIATIYMLASKLGGDNNE